MLPVHNEKNPGAFFLVLSFFTLVGPAGPAFAYQ
jgi:hypothetical protein